MAYHANHPGYNQPRGPARHHAYHNPGPLYNAERTHRNTEARLRRTINELEDELTTMQARNDIQ